MSWRSLRRQVTLGLCSAAAIIAAASFTRPVFVGRASVLRDIVSRIPAVDSTARSPWLVLPADRAVLTPQFFADRQAFVSDLLRTGKVTPARAWQLADVAVREAYTRRVPPALVLGVMLTENDEFKSTAKSSAGALGLMQVHPKPWRVLAGKFGPNLKNDSTNLKYGIYILGFLAGEAAQRTSSSEDGWRNALLRYNGCKRGTNTPDCHRYPDVVRRNVIRGARYSCGQLDFLACVVQPLWMAKNTERAGN